MVNISSLKFFKNLRATNRQFAVIGLGRFGRAVCLTLHGMGYEVMGIDSNESRVAQVLTDQIAAHAVQLDSTQPSALLEAGIPDFDTVIIAIGNYVQESIITTLNVKEAGVANVVAKASSAIHGKILIRVGADHVIFPEHEMGCELARSLTRPGILDRFELDPDHSIVEVVVPPAFNGKTIMEIDLRNRYGLTLMAISKDDVKEDDNDKFIINPSPIMRLRGGSLMVVIGDNKGIDKLPV